MSVLCFRALLDDMYILNDVCMHEPQPMEHPTYTECIFGVLTPSYVVCRVAFVYVTLLDGHAYTRYGHLVCPHNMYSTAKAE